MVTDKEDLIADEQLRMNDCYYEKRDWRSCQKEVSKGRRMEEGHKYRGADR